MAKTVRKISERRRLDPKSTQFNELRPGDQVYLEHRSPEHGFQARTIIVVAATYSRSSKVISFSSMQVDSAIEEFPLELSFGKDEFKGWEGNPITDLFNAWDVIEIFGAQDEGQ